MFYYFAFGSNLLKERIQLSNKSAEYVGVGVVNDYILSFGGYSNNCCVYGTVWKMCMSDMRTLDLQESAPVLYRPVEVSVKIACDTSSDVYVKYV
uniref:gamma-glutamylcyclotransferase n=1 Tax=Trichobilharzia regenti TaxID=157069 RepID=A0AA85JU93_TRIRE|nr:unnamed protein product [Trichobilharzia regenti]